MPVGEDLCAGALGKTLLATRDSGKDELQPFSVDGSTILSLGSPMYRGGVTPTTVAGRRAAFVGWVGMTLVPQVILATSVGGYAHTEVALRFGSGASAVVFTSGRGPAGQQVTTVDLHDGWTVETLAKAAERQPLLERRLARPPTRRVSALSCLLGVLIYVLGTGRGRAMQLVHERTDQLRFQALHDAADRPPKPDTAARPDRADGRSVAARRRTRTR